MIKKFIPLIFVCGNAFAFDIPEDKVLHTTISAFIGTMVVSLHPNMSQSKQFMISMIPGISKEVYDSRPGGSGWSWGDLAADAVGSGVGVYTANWSIRYQKNSVQVAYHKSW